MIDQAEWSRTVAFGPGGEGRVSVTPRREKAAIKWLAGARWVLDPLVLVPFVLIAVWAVLAAGSIATLGEIPVGARAPVREPPVAEEIIVIAPSAHAGPAPVSTAVRVEADVQAGRGLGAALPLVGPPP
jgi:hypothetical protein